VISSGTHAMHLKNPDTHGDERSNRTQTATKSGVAQAQEEEAPEGWDGKRFRFRGLMQ
jgi:hypothetical protein